uniref:Uncharacterized protein n=1 Tax=Sphenodon punctatus TaxID=8508 RepID=A0A8D0GLK2_SPHPU
MMRKAYHLKLLTAILIMFIVSLPEFFKTHEASTITMSCIDARSLKNITFPLCAFNNPCKSHLQQGKKNQTVFLKVFVNHSCLHDPLCVCQVGYSALQPCIVTSSCESNGDQNIIHQGPRSEAQVVKGSLEAKEEDFISVYKHFIYTVDHVNEEREEYQTAYVLEVHIRNSTGRGESAGEETMNH